MNIVDIVVKKLDAHEPAPTILRSIPPADRAAVTEWGAIELAFLVLESSASEHFGPLSWQKDMGATARALARLIVTIWTDPATPHPPEGA